jgi:hypothetical protein
MYVASALTLAGAAWFVRTQRKRRSILPKTAVETLPSGTSQS